MKKYEMTGATIVHQGHKLRRIRALTAFGRIEAGAIGDWIEARRVKSMGAWLALRSSMQICVWNSGSLRNIED